MTYDLSKWRPIFKYDDSKWTKSNSKLIYVIQEKSKIDIDQINEDQMVIIIPVEVFQKVFGVYAQFRNSGDLVRSNLNLSLGLNLHKFRDIKKIGDGAFGKVFKATCVLDQREYAIKIINASNNIRPGTHPIKELLVLSSILHPNIVRYHTSWIEDVENSAFNEFLCSNNGSYDAMESSGSSSGNQILQMSSSKNGSQNDDSRITFRSKSRNMNKWRSTNGNQSDSRITFGYSENRNYNKESKLSSSLSSEKLPVQLRHNKNYILCVQMELCNFSLRTWIDERNDSAIDRHLSERDRLNVVGLAAQLFRGLAYLHEKEIIHRDIKPDNILLSQIENSNKLQLKIGDFGLARIFKQSESPNDSNHEQLSRKGTPFYTAPEVTKGNYDKKCDIYSTGITLIEMMTITKTKSELINLINDVKNGNMSDVMENMWAREVRHVRNMISHNPQVRPHATEIVAVQMFKTIYYKTEDYIMNLERDNLKQIETILFLTNENEKLKKKIEHLEKHLKK